MTQEQNEILARLIRNRFDASNDLDECHNLIAVADKLGFHQLAHEMRNDLN